MPCLLYNLWVDVNCNRSKDTMYMPRKFVGLFFMDLHILHINRWVLYSISFLESKSASIYFDNMVVKYTVHSFNLIKQISLILKPRFFTCICLFLIILFLPKFMINVTILILKLSISLI